MKHQNLISKMTLEEKAGLCSGEDFWHLKSIERLDIPPVMMSDGPHGLRKQSGKSDHLGLNQSVPSTCFPAAVTVASSWDRGLAQEMGEALGEEARAEEISVILGPGVNIKRSPLCGRNFEYFSEDPYLSGQMAVSYINGVQSKGVGTSLKHFAANNQETRRNTINTVIDERTLREIYLPAFEYAVKDAQPWTVMNAYNRLNGIYCSENPYLLTRILRKDWGFHGLVVTDWGAENDRVAGLKAGQELEMPSSGGIHDKQIVRAVRNGDLEESVLNKGVDRILDLIFKASKNLEQEYTYDKKAHHELARKIARESMVLLKNEENILPLKPEKAVAIIGEMARSPRYQGSGSSHINPTQLDCAFDALLEAGVHASYSAGYSKLAATPNNVLIRSACETARVADIAVVFIGLTESYESEGFDRKHLRLPASHNVLIDEVCKANDNVVVVLSGGAPVEMPWLGKVKAVLNGYLGGQAGGSAIADLLTGRANPCGKLAETYPKSLVDTPSVNNFPGSNVTVEYREGIYVGYRYYDKLQKDVLFPFGYGLSYTSFKYTGLKLGHKQMNDTDELTVSFKVRNEGDTDGAEVAQIYVADVESTVFKAPRELKGFAKVFLKAGEEQLVTVTLGPRDFAYYNTDVKDWHVEDGVYQILIGASSRDIRLKGSVRINTTRPEIAAKDLSASLAAYYTGDVGAVPDDQYRTLLGHEIPSPIRDSKQPFDMNSTLMDAKDTKWGRIILKAIDMVLTRIAGEEKYMYDGVKEWPIRSFMMMSNGLFNEDMSNGMVMILNNKDAAKGMLKLVKGLGGSAKNLPKIISSL